MKFIAIADSDSYLKWGAAFLGALPAVTDRELMLIETPVLPSAGQRAAALAVAAAVLFVPPARRFVGSDRMPCSSRCAGRSRPCSSASSPNCPNGR